MSVALPQTPLVPVLVYSDPLETIPAEARALYERRTCDLLEAGEFLGFRPRTDAAGNVTGPSNTVYGRVKRYQRRTAPLKARPPYDPIELLPKEGEIAAVKGATWMVDTHMLVNLRYPQVSPW